AQNNRIARNAVAITFDDGYADNLYNAKPLLERHEVPASIFVVANGNEWALEFWWDELEKLFIQPGTLPRSLHLKVIGITLEADLAESAVYSETAFQMHRSWRFVQGTDPTPRHRAYRLLYQTLRPLTDNDRRAALNDLFTWAGMRRDARASHRRVTL